MFGLVALFNDIPIFVGYLKQNNSCGTIYLSQGKNTSSENISTKVNITAQLEFELAYYNVKAYDVSHYATSSLFIINRNT